MALIVSVVTSVLVERVAAVSVYAGAVLELTASVTLIANAPRKVQDAASLDLANVVSFTFIVLFLLIS